MRRHRIGETPLVALPMGERGRVSLKAEYANPFGSVKDRAAAYLLAWALEMAGGGVRPVESTSGNLGVALARLGAALGVRPTIVMDASVPAPRVREAAGLGADVRVVAAPRTGMTLRETRIAVAHELGERPGHVWLNQYGNAAGVHVHRETTGPEILDAMRDDVDAIVASVGTGGTLCGIGAAMRDAGEDALVVGVEPVGSTIAGGCEGDYLPAGAGMRGPPDIVCRHGDVIDRFAQVPDAVAATWALRVRHECGIAVGPTTGAAVAVAAQLASRERLNVVAVAPDGGDAFLPAMRRLAGAQRDAGWDRLRWCGPRGANRWGATER